MNTTARALGQPAVSGRKLHFALWGAQILLAIAFAFAGLMKLTTPIAEMAKSAAWVADLPGFVRFIGAAEVAGAIGLILPAATRILPVLTPVAAGALALVMVFATAFHAARAEFASLPVTLILFAMALFVVWGRTKREPIRPRS